ASAGRDGDRDTRHVRVRPSERSSAGARAAQAGHQPAGLLPVARIVHEALRSCTRPLRLRTARGLLGLGADLLRLRAPRGLLRLDPNLLRLRAPRRLLRLRPDLLRLRTARRLLRLDPSLLHLRPSHEPHDPIDQRHGAFLPCPLPPNDGPLPKVRGARWNARLPETRRPETGAGRRNRPPAASAASAGVSSGGGRRRGTGTGAGGPWPGCAGRGPSARPSPSSAGPADSGSTF